MHARKFTCIWSTQAIKTKKNESRKGIIVVVFFMKNGEFMQIFS